MKYVDPDGKEVVPLGQHTNSEIDKRLADIELELAQEVADATDKESRSRRSELEAEARTLRAEKEGNATVGAWLDALDATGQNNGMKLSDFVLTTDPADDLAKAATDAGESRVAIADIVMQGSGTELIGTVIKGQIYILQTSDVYQATLRGGVTGTAVGDISRDDVARLGGSYLSHEDYHKRNGRSEYDAYSHQERVLDNMNQSKSPFQNQAFLQDLKNGIRVTIQRAKLAEGR